MIKAANSKIIVRVDPSQKNEIKIGDITMTTALLFENNYREKSPVVGVIVQGNEFVKQGQVALFHHNHFHLPSPYHVEDDLFSVPFNKTFFGVLNEDGDIEPMCGNIICERVLVEYAMPVPVDEQKTHIDRARIINPGLVKPYKSGELIFHRPHAGYDIVYNWFGEERRVTKVHEDMIIGYVENKYGFKQFRIDGYNFDFKGLNPIIP